MIIYYTEGFKRVLNDSSQYIKLSKFKLSTVLEISSTDLINLTADNLEKKFITSPTGGYYKAEGILLDSLLTLSIEIPDTDVSISNYTVLLVFYENLLIPTEYPQLAFILSSSMTQSGLGSQSKVIFGNLNLEPDRSIINLTNFNSKCSIILSHDTDTEFLEGKGLGVINNLFFNDGNQEIRYVSRESYEAYLLEQRGYDELEHSYTQYINSYGFKIY